jgi:hypothetical protein
LRCVGVRGSFLPWLRAMQWCLLPTPSSCLTEKTYMKWTHKGDAGQHLGYTADADGWWVWPSVFARAYCQHPYIGRPGFDSLLRKYICLYYAALEPTKSPVQWVRGLFHGIKAARAWSWHITFSAEGKDGGGIPPRPHVFFALCLIKSKDNFTVTIFACKNWRNSKDYQSHSPLSGPRFMPSISRVTIHRLRTTEITSVCN